MLFTLLQITPTTGSSVAAVSPVADTTRQVAAAANTIVADKPDNFDFSVWSMIQNGGPIMIPIGILFVLTLYVLIERLLVLNKLMPKHQQLLPAITPLVQQGNIDSARAMCKAGMTPEHVIIDKGLSRIGQPPAEIREAMTEAAKVEVGKLEKRLGLLSVCGKIAPLLGFIGTIIGVIKIFYDINHAGKVDIEHVSGGLYVKMVSSAGGLVVGVIAFIAYHWVNTMIDKAALRLEETQMKFMDMLQEPQK
jgi:biopolymer transport protein ExbB